MLLTSHPITQLLPLIIHIETNIKEKLLANISKNYTTRAIQFRQKTGILSENYASSI